MANNPIRYRRFNVVVAPADDHDRLKVTCAACCRLLEYVRFPARLTYLDSIADHDCPAATQSKREAAEARARVTRTTKEA